jgi:hypothetical protein
MPGKLSFDDLDLREEPSRNDGTSAFITTRCGNTDYCTDACSNTPTTGPCTGCRQ